MVKNIKFIKSANLDSGRESTLELQGSKAEQWESLIIMVFISAADIRELPFIAAIKNPRERCA